MALQVLVRMPAVRGRALLTQENCDTMFGPDVAKVDGDRMLIRLRDIPLATRRLKATSNAVRSIVSAAGKPSNVSDAMDNLESLLREVAGI